MKKILNLTTLALLALSMSLTSCLHRYGWSDNPSGDTPEPTNVIDLSKLTGDYLAKAGDVLTGTLMGNFKITIADGATITLAGVTISGGNNNSCKWAGLTAQGNANIILKDGSTNTVSGFHQDYPGILAAVGKQLAIKGETAGTGTLIATSGGSGDDSFAAAIGGGNGIACGNIVIQGGNIIATAGSGAAAIGGGSDAACGTITITDGVRSMTATKGGENPGPNSIGAGEGGTCGTVTTGCKLDDNGNPVGGTTGAITEDSYIIEPPATIDVTSVTLDKTSLPLTIGDAAVQLTATVAPSDATDKTVTWTSDKPAIATVDATGKVTPVAAGTATITAKAGDKTATCTVTVAKKAGSISYATAAVNKQTTDAAFTNALTKVGDGNVSYSTNAPTVATVNASTGEVTIVGAGNATITATVADSDTYSYATKTATYTISVTNVGTGGLSDYIWN